MKAAKHPQRTCLSLLVAASLMVPLILSLPAIAGQTITINSSVGHDVWGNGDPVDGGNPDGDERSISGNTLVITTGASFTDGVFGARAISGNVENNIIEISGTADVHGLTIYGGYSGSGNATNNTISISGAPNIVDMTLNGGFGTGEFRAGNTLKLINIRNTDEVTFVTGFENFHFQLPAGIANNEVILNANEVNLGDDANVTLSLAGKPSLAVTEKVILIKAAEGSMFGNIATPSAYATYGATDYLFDISVDTDDDALIARLSSETERLITRVNQAKAGAYTYGPAASSAALTNAYDSTISLIDNWHRSSRSHAATSGSSLSSFASLQGSSIKTKTGSSVDSDGFSFVAGGAWEQAVANGNLLGGIFAEGGQGSYDAHNSFGGGDGDTWHYGIGGFGKFRFNEGAYFDGSFRFGRVKVDYDNRDSLGYDSKTNYWSAHAGAGYEYALSSTGALDGYAKVLWTTLNSDTVTTKADEKLHFNRVDSLRSRLGGRYIHTADSGLKAWGGLAWEREFDGKAKSSLDGVRINHTTKTRGNTGIVEAGLEYNTSKWRLSGGVQGFFGKREGVAGTLTASYKF
jgi:outer membrane autotransporter protein